MLRTNELRLMDEDELNAKLRELKEALFNLRFQHATGQLENPMKIKETRRDIARICTVMTERELGIHREAFEEARLAPPGEPVPSEEEVLESGEDQFGEKTRTFQEQEPDRNLAAGEPVAGESAVESPWNGTGGAGAGEDL